MSAIGRHVAKLSGYAPALPTPFDAEGAIDVTAFERLQEREHERDFLDALAQAGLEG